MTRIIGLPNVGNSCYFNACLQTLIYNESLFNILKNLKTDDNIIQYFVDLQQIVFDDKKVSKKEFYTLVTKLYVAVIMNKQMPFKMKRQEDSSEFLLYLIDHFYEQTKHPVQMKLMDENKFSRDEVNSYLAWKKMFETKYSQVLRLFYGQSKSILTCNTCKHKSITYDTFNTLTLPTENCRNVMESFLKYGEDSEVDGVTCDGCKVKKSFTKRVELCILPRYLFIKIKNVLFPSPKKQDIDIEHKLNLNILGDTYQYNLESIIYHRGKLNSGHYFAGKLFGGIRIMMDDDNIGQVPELVTKDATVLCYMYNE